jgi:hypothetical protein
MATSFGINDSGVQFKFSESVWKMLFYLSSFSWGLLLVIRRNWSWAVSYDACFDHVPALYSAPDEIDADIYLFYIFQIGFYLHSIYAHLFIETRRNDFVEMLVHHVATLLLIAISFSTRFTAVGTLIVVVHDFSDILLEIAKTYIYRSNDTLANFWFTLWVLSWIALRLVYFPFYILPASVYVSVGKIGYYPHYITCAIMLITLQILHIFWSFMIARMIYRMFAGTADKIRDTREDDESTDDESSADGAAKNKPAAPKEEGNTSKDKEERLNTHTHHPPTSISFNFHFC